MSYHKQLLFGVRLMLKKLYICFILCLIGFLYSCTSNQIYIFNAEFSMPCEIQLVFQDKNTVLCPVEASGISILAINGEEIGEREKIWYLDENEQFQGLYSKETDEIISLSGDVIYKVIERTRNKLVIYSLQSGNEYEFYLKNKGSNKKSF